MRWKKRPRVELGMIKPDEVFYQVVGEVGFSSRMFGWMIYARLTVT